MNEKFSIKTGETEKAEGEKALRGLDGGEIEKMKMAAKRFEITRDFYRKAMRDSAEKILEEWLKLKEIKKFQKVYPQF